MPISDRGDPLAGCTPKSISLTGDASGTVEYDGTLDVDLAVTVIDDSHNHTSATIPNFDTDVTAILQPTLDDVTALQQAIAKVPTTSFTNSLLLGAADGTAYDAVSVGTPVARADTLLSFDGSGGLVPLAKSFFTDAIDTLQSETFVANSQAFPFTATPVVNGGATARPPTGITIPAGETGNTARLVTRANVTALDGTLAVDDVAIL